VEVVQERRKSELSRQDFRRFLDEHLLVPLQLCLHVVDGVILDQTRERLTDVSDPLLIACRHVEHASSALASALALRSDLHHAGDALRIAAPHIEAAKTVLGELAQTRHWGEATLDDLNRTRNDLHTVLGSLAAVGEKNDPS
jgi:hypothetical protein